MIYISSDEVYINMKSSFPILPSINLYNIELRNTLPLPEVTLPLLKATKFKQENHYKYGLTLHFLANSKTRTQKLTKCGWQMDGLTDIINSYGGSGNCFEIRPKKLCKQETANMAKDGMQCMPIIFMTHRSFSVILSSHIGNPSEFASVMTDGPM